jgi:hypothetical protein
MGKLSKPKTAPATRKVTIYAFMTTPCLMKEKGKAAFVLLGEQTPTDPVTPRPRLDPDVNITLQA